MAIPNPGGVRLIHAARPRTGNRHALGRAGTRAGRIVDLPV